MGFVTLQYHVVFDNCFSTVFSGDSDDGTMKLWEKLFSYWNSTFDYLSEENDVFEASRFERGKSEEEHIAKYQLQQNEQPPINTPSNKPSHKHTGSFHSNDKRKTILGEPTNNNNSNNNSNNSDDCDYTNSDNASVDNNGVSPSEGDNMHCSRRTRKQPTAYRTSRWAEWRNCEDLRYAFIERPKTILAAYYANFQKLSYDLDSASEKDDLTWAEERVSGKFELFKKAARKETASI